MILFPALDTVACKKQVKDTAGEGLGMRIHSSNPCTSSFSMKLEICIIKCPSFFRSHATEPGQDICESNYHTEIVFSITYNLHAPDSAIFSRRKGPTERVAKQRVYPQLLCNEASLWSLCATCEYLPSSIPSPG